MEEKIAYRILKPDFDSLQSRDKTKDALRSKMLAKMYPATLIAFDILLADGSDTKDMSLMDRHDLLRAMIIDSPELQVSRLYTQTLNTYNWAKEQGLEGVVVKRSNSSYELGIRSPNWLKCKVKFTEDLEVVEFSENPKGIRATTIEGTAVQISGAQAIPVKEEIMKNHKALIEVSAMGSGRTESGALRQIVFVRLKL